MEEPQPLPQILASCRSGRRSCGDSNSPEFEFWMVRNPSFPQPNLLSADELFSDGVLLPLQHLNLSNETPPRENVASGSDRGESSATESGQVTSATSALTSSKRWRDIFRKSDKKNGDDHCLKEKDNNVVKERKREKKKKNGVGVGGSGATPAELNINIWPFARSRSAGNSGTRPRAAATRKVSSAPCSRSNSRGESKSRKWPTSPGRAGVHLGRTSPVWQVRRRNTDAVSDSVSGEKRDGNEGRRRVPVAGGNSKAKVMSLNVPVCMGYRQHFSCRSDEVGAATQSAGGEGVRGSNLFNLRSLFTSTSSKKVY